MAWKPTPLEDTINGVRIIEDLGTGYLKDTSKTKTRNAIVACPSCDGHRKMNVYALRNATNVVCPSCANTGENNGAYIHGMNGGKVNKIWVGMKKRCNNPNDKDYPNYGGKGVTVCAEWDAFVGFEHWVNGRLDEAGMSIERLDATGNYEPSNCIVIPVYLQPVTRRDSIGLYKAYKICKYLEEYGKQRGYIGDLMDMLDIEDYQVKQFVLYNKHHDEILALAETYPVIKGE